MDEDLAGQRFGPPTGRTLLCPQERVALAVSRPNVHSEGIRSVGANEGDAVSSEKVAAAIRAKDLPHRCRTTTLGRINRGLRNEPSDKQELYSPRPRDRAGSHASRATSERSAAKPARASAFPSA